MGDPELNDLSEDLEDSQSLSVDDLAQAVVTATDWTTETIVSQLNRENINISPRFQRRDAWSLDRKSRFIESLIVGLPVPQIVLAEAEGRKGRYVVLDGRQRLLTLLQFTGHAQGKKSGFFLRGLQLREDLNKKTYADLSSTSYARDDLDRFMNQTIRSVVIRNWPSVAFLHTVFIRLNMGSVQLSPQELRQALFPGPFVDYADDAASDSPGLRTLLHLSEPDFRMRDLELLVRYLAFQFFLTSYSGDLKGFLDETCLQLNKAWDAREVEIKERVARFEVAVKTAIEIFGKNDVGKRWGGSSYEGRFNRAILDALVFYFSDSKIAAASLEHPEQVLAAFKDLCSNTEFLKAVEASTKTIGATYARFALWGEKLRQALPIKFNVPKLEDGRMAFQGLWA